MAWLIKERSRLKGLLDRYRAQLASLPREIVAIEQQLAALDQVIPLHEVKVDPQRIQGTRPQSEFIMPPGLLGLEYLGFAKSRKRQADPGVHVPSQ